MKKYKIEFDYKFQDCFHIAAACVGVFLATFLIFSFLAGFFISFLGTDVYFVGFGVPIIITLIYSIIYIVRYILEGITIVEIEENK